MIPASTEAQILRLFHVERWPVGTIARQVGVHHETVRRVLRDNGIAPSALPRRKSKADPYLPFILETLERYPTLLSSRLFDMVRERGYDGGPDHFRAYVARYRPRPAAEAFLRLRTLPGQQAQVDWAHFGRLPVAGYPRPLVAFVMVLSWSRAVFLRFGLDQRMGSFLEHHEAAFEHFGGVPRVLLYDNLKSAVIERNADAIRFNETLLRFAGWHRYEPRPVAPYRGNEKGRVERAIRYVRDRFFAARSFVDLDDLNRQALAWSLGVAGDRPCPEDRTMTVSAAWEQERPTLLPLRDDAFPVAEHVAVRVGKTPYVRFDLNDYSVPHDRVRRTLVVVATSREVRVLDGDEVVATHVRWWGKAKQVEDPTHFAALVAEKRKARQARGTDRLGTAVPASRTLLEAAALRGGNLGALVQALIRLLDAWGAEELELAITEALENDAPHLHAVRQILDRRRHARNQPPPIAVPLPDDPRIRDLVVRPHPLADYDHLNPTDDNDDDHT